MKLPFAVVYSARTESPREIRAKTIPQLPARAAGDDICASLAAESLV